MNQPMNKAKREAIRSALQLVTEYCEESMTKVDDPGDDPAPTLGESGQIYVTQAATLTYKKEERLGGRDEEARRELTKLLIQARRVPTSERPDGPQVWRTRRRSVGLDINAHVSPEWPLMVVVAISVRPLNTR